MKRLKFSILASIFAFLLCLSLTSCDPVFIEKNSETADRIIYAIGDAVNVGNLPLATKYINQAYTLFPIPKNRIQVTPVVSNGIHYVILGDNLKNTQVVVVGSVQFNSLLKMQADIANQIVTQQKLADKINKQAIAQAEANKQNQNLLIDSYNKVVARENKWHSSIFYKAFLFFTTLQFIIPISIVGAIILCFFCPALIPIILTVAGTVCGTLFKFASALIMGIFNFVSSLLTKKS